MRNFLRRPLTMNTWVNAISYGAIIYLTDTLINKIGAGQTTFWQDTGCRFLFYSTVFVCTLLSIKENNWVREILKEAENG